MKKPEYHVGPCAGHHRHRGDCSVRDYSLQFWWSNGPWNATAMTMSRSLCKFALTTPVTSTVGWLGAIAGFLAMAIGALITEDVQVVRGAYLAMQLMGWYVLVPLCIASLATGLIMSLGTSWGLFRHYWVLVKFVITVLAAIILFMYTQTLDQLGAMARDTTLSISALRNPSPVLHSGLAVLALLLNTTLSIYKPKGMTRYGRRKQRELGVVHEPVSATASAATD